MDHNTIKHNILNFKLGDCTLGNQGYNRVLLQLFGFLGHGKSSFINSCKFTLDGEYKTIAEAGDKCGGFTMERRSYELRDTITLVDNRGFVEMSGFQTLEVYAQLGNFCPPLNEQVVWKEDYEELMSMIEDADMNPNFVNFIVPILIHSVQRRLHEKDEWKMKHFLNNCRDMIGIFPIVVLTNKTHGDYVEVEKMFKRFGAEVVFAIENYTEENHLMKPGTHADILNILHNALKDVSFCLGIERDPKRERVKRKKFILHLAHEITLAEQREQDRKEQNEHEQDRRTMTNYRSSQRKLRDFFTFT